MDDALFGSACSRRAVTCDGEMGLGVTVTVAVGPVEPGDVAAVADAVVDPEPGNDNPGLEKLRLAAIADGKLSLIPVPPLAELVESTPFLDSLLPALGPRPLGPDTVRREDGLANENGSAMPADAKLGV